MTSASDCFCFFFSIFNTEYKCPKGFKPGNIDFSNRREYTFTLMFSFDSPHCALKGVKGKGNCKKPNGRRKFWKTFQFGYGMFEIRKFDTFSNLYSNSDPSATGSDTDTPSSFDVPQKFAISAIYFRVRGANRIIIQLLGDVGQTVSRLKHAQIELSIVTKTAKSTTRTKP